MSDAERMARAWRDAMVNNDAYLSAWSEASANLKRNYIKAAQSLLDAGYQMPPPPRETTVDDTHIGGWVKLHGLNLCSRHYNHDRDGAEADALNAIVAWSVQVADFGTPITSPNGVKATARQLLVPLGITTETMRPPAKTVRVKCPNRLHTARCGDHRCCTICHGQLEYDAELVEDNDAGK